MINIILFLLGMPPREGKKYLTVTGKTVETELVTHRSAYIYYHDDDASKPFFSAVTHREFWMILNT